MSEVVAKKSDLGVRTLSALVMIAIAGTALWASGWVWVAFVALVAAGVLWEWRGLVNAITANPLWRIVWLVAGLIYVGLASLLLAQIGFFRGGLATMSFVAIVVAIDVGAYFFGRSIGGPKIAPSISPSKTWAGLLGGVFGAALALSADEWLHSAGTPASWGNWQIDFALLFFVAALYAVVAQAGDFFESWMKRRAGVKDSGNLIPGHGGLFDRVDGLIAVLFVMALSDLHFFGIQAVLCGGAS